MSEPHWSVAYLGKPYEEGGCWLLFQEVQRARYGRAIEAPPSLAAAAPVEPRAIARSFLGASKALRWVEVKRPKEGDAVLMGEATDGHHVGTYVEMKGGPRVLHTLRGAGSACVPIARLEAMRFNIVGFYRPEAEA